MWDKTYLVGLGVISALVTAGMWVGSMNEHKNAVIGFMSEIRDELRQLRSDVGKLLGRPVPVDANSPLALTEYGKDLSDKLGAAMWAKQEANSLQDEDTGTEQFEIEEFSFDHVRKKYPTTRDMEKSLRAAIYEHGLNKDHVYDVLAVVLRDELINRTQQAQ